MDRRGVFSRWRKTGGIARDQRGAVAVEFALIAVPFFFLLGCIFEEGLIMLTEYSLQRGTERAARLIRIGSPPATVDAFRQRLCEDVFLLPNCSTTNPPVVRVRNAKTFTGLETASLPSDYEPGTGGSAVEVKVTYRWEYLFPLWRLFDPDSNVETYGLTAVSVFRNEPF